ncbi:hypothetical protein PH213_32495 [Streptomyces sp. SRF1]|uniref:hypothetical protein n=1 Tax=Streptomyces sp. SRF1 TaxID=1549642 RepID=UPI0025AF91C6|nr:hypothetical protein [Streptomyces sp. SRF1]MDN3059169.1 hypothetical protein [Streptomyces sp. SRF1]
MPKAFWAFHDQYCRAYRRYAHVHLSDPHAAGELVHQVLMHLAMNWAHLMEKANPAASAWALLKESAAGELRIRAASPQCPRQPCCSSWCARCWSPAARNFEVIESALGLSRR